MYLTIITKKQTAIETPLKEMVTTYLDECFKELMKEDEVKVWGLSLATIKNYLEEKGWEECEDQFGDNTNGWEVDFWYGMTDQNGEGYTISGSVFEGDECIRIYKGDWDE